MTRKNAPCEWTIHYSVDDCKPSDKLPLDIRFKYALVELAVWFIIAMGLIVVAVIVGGY